MKLHANAHTCPKSRRLLVSRIEEEGWLLTAAAEAAGVSERTARKWLAAGAPRGSAALRIEARRQGGCPGGSPPHACGRSRRCGGCG
jgi:leucine-zipper of insertion element IS481